MLTLRAFVLVILLISIHNIHVTTDKILGKVGGEKGGLQLFYRLFSGVRKERDSLSIVGFHFSRPK
jgi:hypothetical protein